MISRLSITAAFLMTISFGYGQGDISPVEYHIIHLENGSEIKGEILAWNSDSIRFRLSNGVELAFASKEVDKVVSLYDGEEEEIREYNFKERGIYNVSTMGPSAGPDFGLSATHAIGYRFSRMLSTGIGTGIESFEMFYGSSFIPVFAEVRGFFLPKRISPYYAARLGYGFALGDGGSEKATGGAMGLLEVGCRFGSMFFTGIGVHVQNAKFENRWGPESGFVDKITYRRTELRLGFIF